MKNEDRSFTPSRAFVTKFNPGGIQLEKKLFLDLIDTARQIERVDLGPQRFSLVAKEVEKAITDWGQKDKTSCKRGCNFCCFQQVTLKRSEAITLASIVKAMNPFKRQKIITTMKRQAQARDEIEWTDLPSYYKKCIFLESGLCSIYEYRPISCRTFYVISPPSMCKQPENSRGPTRYVSQSFSGLAEYIHTAFSGCEGEAYYEGGRRILVSLPQAILREMGISYGR